jgi:antitoxin component HigA of HigAB toxin-antitoxin module
MNKTRPLTLDMIRRLVAQLDLPADVLVKPYLLREQLMAA